jgi:hypothetical protein
MPPKRRGEPVVSYTQIELQSSKALLAVWFLGFMVLQITAIFWLIKSERKRLLLGGKAKGG